MTTRNAKIEVRCTSEEKARWVEAAGGPRRVSDWIRSLANAAASSEPLLHEPVVEATKLAFSSGEGLVPNEPIPPAPSIPPVSIGKTNDVHTRCPREHHHRPNTYCASCKRTPIKTQRRA